MNRFFLVLLLALPITAVAESGFYVGGILGFTDLDDDGMGNNQDFEDGSGMLSVHGGYHLSPYLAVQLNLDMLGAYEGETPTADIYNSYSALTVSILPRLPLGGGVSVYGELGGGIASIYQWVDGVVGPFYYDDETEINTALATVYGIGFAYDLPTVAGLKLCLGYRQTRFDMDAWAISNTGFLVEEERNQKISQFYAGANYDFQ